MKKGNTKMTSRRKFLTVLSALTGSAVLPTVAASAVASAVPTASLASTML